MGPLNIQKYPRAIIHIDGDSFFVSCEQAANPHLKGKPVVTGKERGIASAMSYEAKAAGITRGMSVREIKRICPKAIILPSCYETYHLYALRMFEIARRYTPIVEEYSIDECFADITGMQRPLNMSYEAIGNSLKQSVENELGISVSVGLSCTKVLSKVASSWNKPSGFAAIPALYAHNFLDTLPVEKLWGIGSQTRAFLNSNGIITALQLATQSEEWILNYLTKPHYELWKELKGQSMNPVNPAYKSTYKSISKTKTFTPPSTDKSFVWAQLSNNIECACRKLRKYRLAAKNVCVLLVRQDFNAQKVSLELNASLSTPSEILNSVSSTFNAMFEKNVQYRKTGIMLSKLHETREMQLDLFDEVTHSKQKQQLFDVIDTISKKHGEEAVFLGSSLKAISSKETRKNGPKNIQSTRKKIAIPYLGIAI